MIIPKTNNNVIIRGGLERKDSAEISVDTYYAKKSEKKVVSFYPEVLMIEIMHHKNYNREEKMDCWYHKSEFIEMKKESQQIKIQLMKEKKTGKQELEQLDNNSVCSRGLENRIIVEQALKRKAVIKTMRRAVLEEQEIQRRHQNYHHRQQEKRQGLIEKNAEEAIATCCIPFSKYCALEAYDMGLRDEVEAFRIMNPKQVYDAMDDEKNTTTTRKRPQWISFSSL